MEGELPPLPDGPILFCELENPLRDRRQPKRVGVFVPHLIENAFVKVGSPVKVRNALTWAVVIVRYRENFLIAGLELCQSHASILTHGLALTGVIRRFHQLRIGRSEVNQRYGDSFNTKNDFHQSCTAGVSSETTIARETRKLRLSGRQLAKRRRLPFGNCRSHLWGRKCHQ